MPPNRLAQETSPYLLQHADNPVDWRPWGGAALADARDSGRPILLSVGYAACHWCHVMAHESFEDAETAALMNELFVNIKVDREERPDIDAIYQHALHLMGQHGGWPLTMFLSPDGRPFWGGTYFPNEPRYGRPGFRDVLKAVAEFYRDKPERVQESAGTLQAALERFFTPQPGGAIPMAMIDEAAERLTAEFDTVEGGIGGAPKFPNPSILELIWRGAERTGNTVMREAVLLTLARMCQGGIYDHLGGGFARYATDARWLVPHFEKMLYDNAQLLDLLVWAWQRTGTALFRDRAVETAEWVRREMVAEGGGFASSLDADSEGEEGRFYVWTEAEIDALLGADAALFKRVYDVRPGGNWEGRTILHRNHPAGGPASAADEATLARCRAALLAARAGRVRPGWDDKVLADWNGLMIAALARVGAVLDRPEDLAAARRAFAFVCETMVVEGRLRHAWRAGRCSDMATLDDLADMARAAVALYETTGEAAYLDRAEGWMAELDAHFRDSAGGGYFFTADDAEGLILRTKSAADNATPSGNGVACAVLARLHAQTGEAAYRDRAEEVVRAFAGEMTRNFFPLATLMNAAELLERTVQVVVVGEPAAADTRALRRAAHVAPAMNKTITVLPPGSALPAGHPAAGKGLVDGRAAAYVCAGQTCSLPLLEPDALTAALAV